MGNRLVCICNMVTEKEIIAALKKGASSAEDIQYATRAGTSCGKCLMTVDQIIAEYEINSVADPQKKINF